MCHHFSSQRLLLPCMDYWTGRLCWLLSNHLLFCFPLLLDVRVLGRSDPVLLGETLIQYTIRLYMFFFLWQVWEALLTLLFFPVCVLMAWIADRRLLFYKYLHRRYRSDKRHGIIVETEGDLAPNGIDIIMEGKFHGNANGGPSNVNNMEKSKDPEQDREEVQRKWERKTDKERQTETETARLGEI